jgi:hypothetical protein
VNVDEGPTCAMARKGQTLRITAAMDHWNCIANRAVFIYKPPFGFRVNSQLSHGLGFAASLA